MLNFILLPAQVEALALAEALRAAWAGQLTWTGTLARIHNRRWLDKHAPEVLAKMPTAVEDGRCECGGVCLIYAVDPEGLYHACQACRATYRVIWEQYQTHQKAR